MNKTNNSSDPLSIYCKEIRDAAPILGLTRADIEMLLARKNKLAKAKKLEMKRKIKKSNEKCQVSIIFIRRIPQFL